MMTKRKRGRKSTGGEVSKRHLSCLQMQDAVIARSSKGKKNHRSRDGSIKKKKRKRTEKKRGRMKGGERRKSKQREGNTAQVEPSDLGQKQTEEVSSMIMYISHYLWNTPRSRY